MKNFLRTTAMLIVLAGIGLVVTGCSGGDNGMGKKNMTGSASQLAQ